MVINIVYAEAKEGHLPEDFGEGSIEEIETSLDHNLLFCAFGNEVTDAAFVENDSLSAEVLIGFDGSVGVDLKTDCIVAHARDAVALGVGADEDLVAEAVGHLKEDGPVGIESRH